MTNFVVDKTKGKFITEDIKKHIKEMTRSENFLPLLNMPLTEKFWNSIKDEPTEVKMAIAVMFDEVTKYGIFNGCKRMPFHFYKCEAVLSFNIPYSFEKIGGQEFRGLTGLTSISVLGNNAFFSAAEGVLYDKFFQHIVAYPIDKKDDTFFMPSTVRDIDSYAFAQNKNLKKIVLSKVLSVLDGDEFNTCECLETIDVPPDNVNFSSSEGILFDKKHNKLIKYPCNKSEKSFSINFNTKSINKYAFSGNNNIEEIILNEGLKKIGMHAFSKCSNLKSINLPESITDIARAAFLDDVSLSSITIPSKIKEIKINTFSGCANLNHVTIPNGVEIIGFESFKNCSSLTEVKLPQSVKTVESYAFYQCVALKKITIPNSVSFIDGSAFAGCKSLESIEYIGTKEQWNRINIRWKKINYKNAIKAIKCSDGTIII